MNNVLNVRKFKYMSMEQKLTSSSPTIPHMQLDINPMSFKPDMFGFVSDNMYTFGEEQYSFCKQNTLNKYTFDEKIYKYITSAPYSKVGEPTIGFLVSQFFDWRKQCFFELIPIMNQILSVEQNNGDLSIFGKNVVARSFTSLLNWNCDSSEKTESFYYSGDDLTHIDFTYLPAKHIPIGTFFGERYSPVAFQYREIDVYCADSLNVSNNTSCTTWLGSVEYFEDIRLKPNHQILGGKREQFALNYPRSNYSLNWNGAYLINILLELNETDISYIDWNNSHWISIDVTNYRPSLETGVNHLSITLHEGMSGQMKDCGPFETYDKNHYTCQDGVFLGPKVSLNDVDCSNLILNKVPYRMSGICGCKWTDRENTPKPRNCPRGQRTCPKPFNMPVSLDTIGSEPFISTCIDGVIFHPMFEHKYIELIDTNLEGIDARGLSWDTFILRGIHGRMENCAILPPQYHCYNNYILGPNVNVQGADFYDIEMHVLPAEDFEGITGILYSCPKTTPKGIRCLWDWKGFRFIGQGINLDDSMPTSINSISSKSAKRRQNLSPNSLFMEDTNSSINLRNARVEITGPCPSMLPYGYSCRSNQYTNQSYVIGPYSNIEYFDLGGLDLSDVDIRGVQGQIIACPDKLPRQWACIGKEGHYNLIGPDSYYKVLDISLLDPNETWTLRHSKVKSIIGRFKGRTCPEVWRLPTAYQCENGYLYGENAILYEEPESIDTKMLTNMKVVMNKNNAFKEELILADHGNCNEMNKLFWKVCPNYIKKITRMTKSNQVDAMKNEINDNGETSQDTSTYQRRLLHSVMQRSDHIKTYLHPSLLTKPNIKPFEDWKIDLS